MICTSSIKRLALALYHRQSAGALFMVLTAYFDESGTHGATSPATVVSGFLANSEQWAEFEHRFDGVCNKFGADRYHSRSLWGSKGCFEGWPLNKKGDFHHSITDIIKETLDVGFSASLSRDDYNKFYKSLNFPRKIRKDTEYGLCFRHCMYFASRYAVDVGDEVNFVLESGHKNSGDAVRVFEDFKYRMDGAHRGFIGVISFDGKESCAPLGAADMFAHNVFKMEDRGDVEEYVNEETYELGDDLASRLPKGNSDGSLRMIRCLITRKEIDLLVNIQMDQYKRRMEFGQRKTKI